MEEVYYCTFTDVPTIVDIRKHVYSRDPETKKDKLISRKIINRVAIGDCVLIKPKKSGIDPYVFKITGFEESPASLPPNNSNYMFNKNNGVFNYTSPGVHTCSSIFGITLTDPPREESITHTNFGTIDHTVPCRPLAPPFINYTYKTPNNNGEQYARQQYLLNRLDNLINAKKTNSANDIRIIKQIINDYMTTRLNPTSKSSVQAQAKTRFREDYNTYLAEFFKNTKPPSLRLEGGTRKRRRNRKQKKTRRSSLKH
jgi:hypothetical protein